MLGETGETSFCIELRCLAYKLFINFCHQSLSYLVCYDRNLTLYSIHSKINYFDLNTNPGLNGLLKFRVC
jgi:hypothetical protein